MPESKIRIDHRSALVRLLRHCSVDQDSFESAMFHFDQAVEQAQGEDGDEDHGEETRS
jgi:hypothetical protein